MIENTTRHVQNTGKCRYNTVEHYIILYTGQQWLKQEHKQTVKWQKAPQSLPLWESYGVPIVSILEKINCVITGLLCNFVMSLICLIANQ